MAFFQLGLRGAVPLPDDPESVFGSLREAPVPLPPRLLDLAERIATDRSFRHAWEWMSASLEASWAEDLCDVGSLSDERFYVIASGLDLWAVDALQPEGPSLCVNPVEGLRTPRVAASSFDELLARLLEDAEDAISIDPDAADREAIATLGAFVHP